MWVIERLPVTLTKLFLGVALEFAHAGGNCDVFGLNDLPGLVFAGGLQAGALAGVLVHAVIHSSAHAAKD